MRYKIARGAAFPVLVLCLWEIGVRLGSVDVFFLPAPSAVGKSFLNMLANGLWQASLWASLKRLLTGFVLSALCAVPLGILAGKTRNVRYWVSPTLTFLQQIPPIAWIPVFILWLGIGEASKIAVIVYAAFFPIFLNTVQGVGGVDPQLIEVGRAFMLKPLRMLRRVYLPSAALAIFTGLRLGLSNCWRALVGAELIAAATGIGALINDGRQLSQPDKIFVAVFTIGLAGMLIDFSLKKLENKLRPGKRMYAQGGK
ncbi:MAG: ABC transporter permease [Peptococcaceae bacterium]|nr:ABC transporter permease [Peptococcaceae bacterium]